MVDLVFQRGGIPGPANTDLMSYYLDQVAQVENHIEDIEADIIEMAQLVGYQYFYATKAEANAAASGLPNLAIVNVLADESHSGYNTIYRKESGSLVYKITAGDPQLRADLAATTGATVVNWLRSGSLIARTVADKLSRDLPLTPFDFGCAGDGSTDDTIRLNGMASVVSALYNTTQDGHINNYYPRLEFPSSNGFLTSTGIVLAGGVQVNMYSPLIVTAASGTPIVGIDFQSNPGVTLKGPRRNRSNLFVKRANFSNWASESDIGVRFQGHYACHVHIEQTWGFTVGADLCMGLSEVSVGEIRQSKIGALITARASPAQFTNHFALLGGEFACDGGFNVGQARYGIEIRSVAPSGANTIRLIGQSFELNKPTAGSAECFPILLTGATQGIGNVVGRNLRSENNSTTPDGLVKATGLVIDVDISFLHSEQEYYLGEDQLLVQDTAGRVQNVKVYREWGLQNYQKWHDVWNSGIINERILSYTGGFITIINMECATNVGAAPAVQTFTTGNYGPAIDTSGYCTNGGPLYGVRVDLNGDRTLGLWVDKKVGAGAQWGVLLFDASGNQLSTTDTLFAGDLPQQSIIPNTGVYGGFYPLNPQTPTSASFAQITLSVKSNVATLFICCQLAHRCWGIRALSDRPTWRSMTKSFLGRFIADALPIAVTNVTYPAGLVAEKITKASGSPPRYSYTGSVWKPEANIP